MKSQSSFELFLEGDYLPSEEDFRTWLNDEEVDLSADKNYAVRWASEQGLLRIVKLLLASDGIDPSERNNYAIRWASERGCTEVVRLLLVDGRVDPSDRNNHAIRWASRMGHMEVIKLLLTDERVDPSVKDNYAIRWASKMEYTEIVQLLLANRRVYSLKLKELVKTQDIVITHLFQRYCYLLRIEAGQDILQLITKLIISV